MSTDVVAQPNINTSLFVVGTAVVVTAQIQVVLNHEDILHFRHPRSSFRPLLSPQQCNRPVIILVLSKGLCWRIHDLHVKDSGRAYTARAAPECAREQLHCTRL
jgi:hypothetical protein